MKTEPTVIHIPGDPTPSQKVSKDYAEKLKAAGYPQELHYGNYYFTDDVSFAHILDSVVAPFATAKAFWKAPTSYELMCACVGLAGDVGVIGKGPDGENVEWKVTVGSKARVGRNLADNLADAWIELQK